MWTAAFTLATCCSVGPVGSQKLFIHTEAPAVPGHKVEVRAEDGMARGLFIFIPYTMLITVSISIVLIITLCISDKATLPLELYGTQLWPPKPLGTT